MIAKLDFAELELLRNLITLGKAVWIVANDTHNSAFDRLVDLDERLEALQTEQLEKPND